MKHCSTANVIVVLACVSRVDIDGRLAGPDIARFETKPKKIYARNFRIEANARLQRAAIVHAVTCIRSKENKIFAGRIMRQATPKTDPRRDAETRNQVDPHRGSYEDRAVVFRDLVQAEIQVFIRVENHWNFNRERGPLIITQFAGVITLK